MDIRSQLKGLSESNVYGSGIYLTCGKSQQATYKLQVDEVKLHKSQKPGGKTFCHLIFSVLETSEPDTHPKGQKVTVTQDMGNTQIAFPALLRFCLAAMGIDPNDSKAVTDAKAAKEADGTPSVDALMVAAIEQNALKGKVVGAVASKHTTQKNAVIDRVTFEVAR